ncbi:MAG: imidazoleglycerol-phosphate dehydratase HisB [Candidatus Bipolaricaulota bacterium]
MKRKTNEVDIEVKLSDSQLVQTGDRVFDHLLNSLFFYMRRPVEIRAEWDLRHHLWEDMGMVVGQQLGESSGKIQIARFGSAIIPMDEALVLAAVDVSRPYLALDMELKGREEGFNPPLFKEFLNALSRGLEATIHLRQLAGSNPHHVLEAGCKSLGTALGKALAEGNRLESTKGNLR